MSAAVAAPPSAAPGAEKYGVFRLSYDVNNVSTGRESCSGFKVHSPCPFTGLRLLSPDASASLCTLLPVASVLPLFLECHVGMCSTCLGWLGGVV